MHGNICALSLQSCFAPMLTFKLTHVSHKLTQACTFMGIQIHTYTHRHTYPQPPLCCCRCTHSWAHTHTHTHTHTQTHRHASPQPPLCCCRCTHSWAHTHTQAPKPSPTPVLLQVYSEQSTAEAEQEERLGGSTCSIPLSMRTAAPESSNAYAPASPMHSQLQVCVCQCMCACRCVCCVYVCAGVS